MPTSATTCSPPASSTRSSRISASASSLAQVDPTEHEGRERAALDWAHAIAWDSDWADGKLWERLYSFFGERELVELGCSIGFELGQQHFVRTLGLRPELPQADPA